MGTEPEAAASIRLYRPADREAVWALAADTAFFGEPIDAFLDDRRPFCETFVSFYTDYMAEWLWVAELNVAVAGYITGCPDTRQRNRVLGRHILPRVLGRAIGGGYQIGRKTLRFAWRTLWDGLRTGGSHVSLNEFPAHLHINVAVSARGHGIGRRLLNASLNQFWAAGLPGVHLSTTDRNHAACHLYEAVGFRVLEDRPAPVWKGLVSEPVHSRIYGLRRAWLVTPK